MGLNTTSTMGSSKSFGLARGKNKVLTQYTFPAGTSTWTAPAGVTSLTSAVGKGSNGTADSWTSGSSPPYDFSPTDLITITSFNTAGSGQNAPFLDWSTVYSLATTEFSKFTAGGSGDRTVSWNYKTGTLYNNNQYSTIITNSSPSRRFRGTAVLSGVAGNQLQAIPTSGSVTYTTVSAYNGAWGGWKVTGLEYFNAGASGSATTGFSLTFPGGTASVPTATNTTFNSVAVTPGTTYTITNNGSLTINYFV
jgi:hypothetical protein